MRAKSKLIKGILVQRHEKVKHLLRARPDRVNPWFSLEVVRAAWCLPQTEKEASK
jgi:hypothetical protein